MDNTAANLEDIHLQIQTGRTLVAPDMALVDDLIREKLASDVVLINQMSSYIIGNGGKRLRPQLVLLAAGACGYQGQHHINTAAIIEFIHTATLLHDDVVDASDMRRGQDTANSVWGNEAAVLVGDFLYSRSFEMMVEIDNMALMDILAATTNRIAEGEVMQLMNVHDPEITEQTYIEVVRAKTARLFEAASRLGGVLSGAGQEIESALGDFGMYLGTAFQIADDVLDYSSDASALGKNVGDDLAEGKTTLPLIYAMQQGSSGQRAIVSTAIREGGLESITEVCDVIEKTGALELSLERARVESGLAQQSLAALPASVHRDAMQILADYSVARLS